MSRKSKLIVLEKETRMIFRLKIAFFTLVLALIPQKATAQTFTCGISGVGYCQYSGKLSRVYINDGNLILVYFEQAVDISLPATVGITGATNGTAARYSLNANAKFADYLYSTALTALAGDKTVAMQFRQAAGYLIVDRIWIYK